MDAATTTISTVEQNAESDCVTHVQTLQKIEQWRPQFFDDFGDRLVVGEKIAEGRPRSSTLSSHNLIEPQWVATEACGEGVQERV